MFHVGNYSVNKLQAVSKACEGMNIIDISGPTKLITGEPILSLEQTFYFSLDSQRLGSSGHIWKNGGYGGYGPSQNIYKLKTKKCFTATLFIFFWGLWKLDYDLRLIFCKLKNKIR